MTTDPDFAALLDFLHHADDPRAPQLFSSANALIDTIAAQAAIIRSLEAELRARRAGDEPLAAILARLPRPSAASPTPSPYTTQDALDACRELAATSSRASNTTAVLEKVARIAKVLLF